jgi:acyl-homoserine-lactone acylase
MALGRGRSGKFARQSLRLAALFSCITGNISVCLASDRSKQVEVAPKGKVNLYRDRFGAAHLYAKREEDGYYGLGYAIAEDRLSSILLLYRALRGELSAAFGAGPLGNKLEISGISPIDVGDAVEWDIRARRARYLEDARENLNRIDPQQRRNAESFIAGIKAYMARHPKSVPSWAPSLEAALPLAAEGFLMMGVAGFPGECGAIRETIPAKTASGSNIWAVSAARTTDNAAAFSSDSHGGYEFFGSIFYPARIKAGKLDVWTLDIAGIPIGLKGHSRNFAWGWAEGPRHPADCIRIKLDQSNRSAYILDGKSVSFEQIPYSIAVKGSAAVRGVFEYTRHNGLRSEVIKRDADTALVVSNAYFGREGFARQQFGAMLRASNWDEMRSALEQRDIYPANLIIAGSDGSIFYIRPGRAPKRATGLSPATTVDGSSTTSAWRGIYGFGELVQAKNPLQGYLTNENASPDMMFAEPFFWPGDYSADLAFKAGDTGTRQLRAIELLRGTNRFGFDELRTIVADPVIAGFERWGVALRVGRNATPTPTDQQFSAFLDALEAFDGRYEPTSKAALYHAVWRIALRDKAPAEATAIELAIGRGLALTPSQNDTLIVAAKSAYNELRAETGGLNRLFGDKFRLGRGRVDVPARGLTLLPRADDPSGETEFGSLWGANYVREPDGRYRAQGQSRFPYLVQFTKPLKSMSVTAYGISDDPSSPHYSDQSERMAAAELHSNYFEQEDLAENLASVTQLIATKEPE